MLQKWKNILGNWINCYFEDTNNGYLVTVESLVTIISHLRENFSLDESTSSILDAHTIQEFILEKYPEFHFENGNLEPVNEEEIYLAASLLLYFVCVNSKDVDIKNAMCKQLSPSDQEIILKFSKCLMDYPKITSTDVLTAITEACGQDVAAANTGLTTVAETPPALRSLHSEVRRLQAALDAERFDRNYLQEELARTNLKMDKLLKDKEQYKQDIVNLKAKLATCSQDNSIQDAEVSNSNTVKLLKQLEQAENRLVTVQEKLDDVQYERDMYKNKMDELKRERDKFIVSSQEETTRACHLAEQLEAERKEVHSLRELVMELRQYSQHNRVDTSQLECDDLDGSINNRTLHNASVCSEACVNVIEVQLGEERAKIIVMEQQIKMLQDQLESLRKTTDEERQNLTQIITEKDTDIFNLKHRINEEIEKNNNLKLCYDDDVTRLNNEVNELEQTLRGNGENARKIIDAKMKEIQILQEEKLSLLQSLNDETTKLENVIDKLKCDFDIEKSSKLKMKEEYENKMMKMNEKVLNRNNELVELQNKICEKGEAIEKLQFDLRKENELRGELINKYNNDVRNLNVQIQAYEEDLRHKTAEIDNLKEHIQKCSVYNQQLEKDIENLNSCLAKCQDDKKVLEDFKAKILTELKSRESEISLIKKEKEQLVNEYSEEKKILQYNLDEVNATTDALRNQLQNEIQYKISIQNKLHDFELKNNKLIEDINNLNDQLTTLKLNCNEMEQSLCSERKRVAELMKTLEDLNIQVEKLNKDKSDKETTIKNIEASLYEAKMTFEEDIREKSKVINVLETKLASEFANLQSFQKKLEEVSIKNNNLMKDVTDKQNIIMTLQDDVLKLTQKVEEYENTIAEFRNNIDEKTKAYDHLKTKYDEETSTLMTKLSEMNKSLKDLQTKLDSTIEAKEMQIETLKVDMNKIQSSLQQECEKLLAIEKEKLVLVQQLNDVNTSKTKSEKEYLDKYALLSTINTQLKEEISTKNEEISDLKKKLDISAKCNEEKIDEMKKMKNDINESMQKTKDIISQKDTELKILVEKIKQLESLVLQSENELKSVIDNNTQVVEALQRENVQLHYTIEEDNSNHELLIREKDVMIEGLETQLKRVTDSLNLLQKQYESDKLTWEKSKIDMIEELNAKKNELTKKVTCAEIEVHNMEALLHVLNKEKTELIEQVTSLRNTCTESAHTNDNLKKNLLAEKALRDTFESEKQNLIKEKDELLQKIAANESAYRKLYSEKESLMNEKAILVQELMEEKSVRQIADEGKGALYVEKQQISEQLRAAENLKNTLLQEKECLTQQLVEERLAKDLAEQEKKNVIDAKDKLHEKFLVEALSKAEVKRKNDSLLAEIQQLEHEYTALNKERASVKTEKDILTKTNTELKGTLDKLILEKTNLLETMSNLNEKFDKEIANNKEKMENLTTGYERLNSDYNALYEDNQKLVNILNSGLNKVFDDIKNDDILNKYDNILIENTNNTEKCDIVFKIINNLISELTLKRNLEQAMKKESAAVIEKSEMIKRKEMQISTLQDEIQNLNKAVHDSKVELIKQNEKHNTMLETKARDIQQLQLENQTLRNELNDVKIQLDVKVHSLKDKLVDNENLTDKLKKTYECQIDNLNMMITKLTNYLKEKTAEIDSLRNEKERLQKNIEDNNSSIKTLEDDLKTQKQNQEKLINDFESERLVLKNMVTVTESVMEDQKVSLNKIIAENTKTNQILEEEVRSLKQIIASERKDTDVKLQEKDDAFANLFKELTKLRNEKANIETELISEKELYDKQVAKLLEEVTEKTSKIETLTSENNEIREKLKEQTEGITSLEQRNNEWKIKHDSLQVEFAHKLKELTDDLDTQRKCTNQLEESLKIKESENAELKKNVLKLESDMAALEKEKLNTEYEKEKLCKTVNEISLNLEKYEKENSASLLTTKNEISELNRDKEDMQTKITKIEECLKSEELKLKNLADEKTIILNKCSILEEYQMKAETELEVRLKEINELQDKLKALSSQSQKDIDENHKLIERLKEEKDAIAMKFNKELTDKNECLENLTQQIAVKDIEIQALRNKLDEIKQREETINILKNENEKLIKAMGQRETISAHQENSSGVHSRRVEHEHLQQQVDTTSTDYSSMESIKTITDLEKIIQDKNRMLTTLQNDITYLKTLVAESETKYLDVAKELDMSKENCQQLSTQLKKIVHQKNEEIADLKKQVYKMSATENRASQIIKVSAKYQAIILKRIAEIKSNTVLKELTNFGNTNCDGDLRKSLTAGTITMEDLENFLETTERHIRRCSEKQIALQKERDRLIEVNKINESEIINIRKFLAELSVSIKTFNSVKEVYTQKLSKVVSVQRTVRREILSLEGRVTDAAMGKLERGYSAAMQDLSECAMNLERWMERCVSRTISSEKIKQAFTSDDERGSLSAGSFQNAGLEVQLEELQNSFQKVLEEVARAQKGENTRDVQSVTIMEVRAEYEDKLNRMKAKMKQIYQEQIQIFKDRQHEDIARLEAELARTQSKLQECEKHIKSLTTELWTVGEKYVMQKEEADWLKKKQRSGSLMSLQHVHSSGLCPPQEERGRPSDTHSLRSLQVNNTNKNKKEGRGMHMSDEEGEVFDNRWLRELASTPRREPEAPPGNRISELRYRNSLCPPHLKSSYPAETQFAPAIQEEDIKCAGGINMSVGGRQRKEVGITAYKKPGPPTPSKQAGRLSATDSELRESLRIDADPSAARKTSTPSRIRSLFRTAKNDTTEGTPRRRLSNIFRKK